MTKQTAVNIGKVFKVTVVATVAFILVIGSLLCCCLTKTAQASTQNAKISSHCHTTKAAQSKANHSKTCECYKISSVYSDSILKISEIIPSFVNSWHGSFIAEAWAPLFHVKHFICLASAGPPGARTSLPLYLQFSNLRL